MKSSFKFTLLFVLGIMLMFSFGCSDKKSVEETGLGESLTNEGFENEPTRGREPTQGSDLIQLCLGFADERFRIMCSAAMGRDIKMCEKIVDYNNKADEIQDKIRCRIWVVATMNKPEMCDSINVTQPEGGSAPGLHYDAYTTECYTPVAVAMKDKNICSKASDQAYCERLVGVADGSISGDDCGKVGVDCYFQMAMKTKDYKWCDELDGIFKTTCYKTIDQDEEGCREIKDLDGWWYCKNKVGLLKSNPSEGNFYPENCGDDWDCEEALVEKMVNYEASH